MRKTVKGILGVSCALFLVSGLAVADSIVFSNFGPGMTFDTNSNDAYFVTGSSFPQSCPTSASCITSQVLGVQFTPSANFDFTSAQVPVFLEAGTNTFDASIEQDMSGLPGSVMSEFQVQNQLTGSPAVATVGESQAGVTLLQGAGSPELVSGTPYWLVLSGPVADTQAAWAASIADIATGTLVCSSSGCSPGSTPSNFAYNTTPNSNVPSWIWFPGTITVNAQTAAVFARPAFQINGTPVVTPPPPTVPEPQTLALTGLGLAGIILLGFKQRLGRQRI